MGNGLSDTGKRLTVRRQGGRLAEHSEAFGEVGGLGIDERVAVGQDCGDLKRLPAESVLVGEENGVREARMHGQTVQELAVRRDLPGLCRDRAEFGQQVERIVEHDLGRRRHPGQGGGLFADHAPLRQFQRELGEVGMFDLRRGEIRHGVLFVFVPETDADAGAVRPARPRRCSAEAFEILTVRSWSMPDAGEKNGMRARPESTTMRIPGIVMLVSATGVARMTRRRSDGANTRSCSAAESDP